MAGGYNIGVAMDARAVEKGVKSGIIEPVEDAVDKLEELGRAGGKAGDGIDRGVRDGARQLDKLGTAGKDAGDDIRDGAKRGDQALDQLGKAGKEAGDDLEAGLKGAQKQTAKTTADYKQMAAEIEAKTAKVKEESKSSFGGAGEASGEFKEEALANFSEVTSSFQGDMTSITDLAQGTFGGLASMGGPASLVFGGIAVAVGLVGQALTQSGEDSDEFKQKIQDLAQTKLGDLFGQYEDSGDDLSRGLRKWATDADSFGGSLLDLQKNARKADLGVGELTAGIATQSIPKMKQLRTEVDAQIKSLDRQAAALSDGTAKGRIASKATEDQAAAAREVKKQLDSNLEVNDAYEKSLRAVAKAQGMTVDQYTAMLDAQQAADEATQALTDSIASQAATMSDTSSDTLSNEAANANQYIQIQQNKINATKLFAENAGKVYQDVDDQTRAYLQSQGTAMSDEYATYLAATPDQQARLREQWSIEAKIQADPSDIDAATAAQGKKTAKGPTSQIKGDTSDLDKKVDKKSKEKPDGPTSQVRADTSKVDDALKKLKGKRVTGPTVVYKVDTSAVTAANRSIANSPVTQIVNQQIGKRVA